MLKLVQIIMLITFLHSVLAVLDTGSTQKPNSSTPVEFYPSTSSDIYNDIKMLNNSLAVFNFHIKNQKLNSSSDSVLRFLRLLKDVNSKIPELQKTYDKVNKEQEMDTIRNNYYNSESNSLLQTSISNNNSGVLILCVAVIVILGVSLVIVWFFV